MNESGNDSLLGAFIVRNNGPGDAKEVRVTTYALYRVKDGVKGVGGRMMPTKEIARMLKDAEETLVLTIKRNRTPVLCYYFLVSIEFRTADALAHTCNLQLKWPKSLNAECVAMFPTPHLEAKQVLQAVKSLAKTPDILSLTPKSPDGIFQNIREIGVATDRVRDAETLIETSRARLGQITAIAGTSGRRPRAFCMEWLGPVYCSGHWVPEMVEIAGGLDSLSRRRADSVRLRDGAAALIVTRFCRSIFWRTQRRNKTMFEALHRSSWNEPMHAPESSSPLVS